MKQNNSTRRHFLQSIVAQSALLLTTPLFCKKSFAISTNKSPNFIFILSDDQGWNGTSAQMSEKIAGSKSDYHLTPNVQQLVEQGMRFSNGYSPAALCCPTRRSIQFGQTPARQGNISFQEKYPRSTQRLTIPRMLKSVNANYRAAHFGKWDLRTDLIPEDLGYDESDGNTRNGEGNAASQFGKSGKWHKILETDDPKQIFTLTAKANDFMQRQVKADRPFYLQISHWAVHVDMHTRPASLQKYEAMKKGELHNIPAFAGMTEDLDAGIGRLLRQIDELGIADNTYIFYMADNGAVPWIPPNIKKHMAHPDKQKNDPSRNYPLRAGKWTLYEGGIRVPFIVKGPGIEAGAFSDTPVIGWDLLPTIGALAGYDKPMPKDVDGGSFKNILDSSGNGKVNRPNDYFVFHRYSKGDPYSALREGKYKLVKFWKSKKIFLFDLEKDIEERIDLSKKMPQKTKELEEKLTNYLRLVDSKILKQI